LPLPTPFYHLEKGPYFFCFALPLHTSMVRGLFLGEKARKKIHLYNWLLGCYFLAQMLFGHFVQVKTSSKGQAND
jgi:hypothetical protein